MKKRKCNKRQFKKVKISKIESTDEKLTSRGGLFFLNEYMESTGIISRLSHKFKYLKNCHCLRSCFVFLKVNYFPRNA